MSGTKPTTEDKPEPHGSSSTFDYNPPLSARMQLFAEVRRAAASQEPGAVADSYARASVAVDLLAARTGDDVTRTEACEQTETRLHMLATAPALTIGDVAPKIAALVLELARSGSGGNLSPGPLAFILASCALADLTILRSGPIPLPARAFDAIDNQETIAHWRQRATESGL